MIKKAAAAASESKSESNQQENPKWAIWAGEKKIAYFVHEGRLSVKRKEKDDARDLYELILAEQRKMCVVVVVKSITKRTNHSESNEEEEEGEHFL